MSSGNDPQARRQQQQQPGLGGRDAGPPRMGGAPDALEQQRHLAVLGTASGSSMPPHEPSVLPGPAAAAQGTSPPPHSLKALQTSTVAAGQPGVRQQGAAAGLGTAMQAAGAAVAGGAAAAMAPAEAAGGAAGGAPAQQQGAAPSPAAQAVGAAGRPAAGSPQAAAGTPAQHPAPAAASPGVAAAADLEAILSRVMQLDTEGWFRHPVRASDAPNYYKIIKSPMCFEVMRSKIRGRQYVNWQEVVRDFELICSNAMKYNQKRSRVHKQALIMLRAGKKLLLELEPEGRRAMAALVAASNAAAAPGSVQLTPADSQAVPSSLYRSGTAGATAAAMLRSQSTADTATTEAESEPMLVDGPPGAAEEDAADPAGYSSYEETDMEEDEVEGAGAARQQAQQLLDAAARDAVLVQPWSWSSASAALAAAGGAEGPAVAAEQQQQRQPGAMQQPAEERPQQGAQQPAAAAAPAAPAAPAHSREWRAVRRGVEWRARWLEHRLTELHHQQQRYRQQLEAELQREARQQEEQQQQRGGQSLPAAAAPAEQQQQAAAAAAGGAQQEGGREGATAASAGAAAAQQHAQPPSHGRLWHHRPHRELAECQLPGLLQHPFIAAHSALCGQQQVAAAGASETAAAAAAALAAAGAVGTGGGGEQQPPAAMDSDDFPAEVHAALDLLDQKLSSLRRQLVAIQRPATQAVLQRVQAVRVPGYRGGGVAGRRAGGGFTPRSAGATPRGTPRSGSLYSRDPLLGKRRRVPEYDMGELITPLGAPKFVERAQVKTIDTPRVRTLPNAEVKKRQAAIEAYTAQCKQGTDEKAALEAIDALCPGESSSEEDTSDEAYLGRHQKMEAEERERYEAVLGAAVKKNKQQSKVSKEQRSKQTGGARPSVARTASAPALVAGNGSAAASAAAAGASSRLASPASSLLPGAASAPAVTGLGPSSPTAGAKGGTSKPAAAAAAPAAAGASTDAAPASAPASGAGSKQAQVQAPAAATQQQQQEQAGQAEGGTGGNSGLTVGKPASSAPAAAATPAGTASLAGPNGLPLVMIPMNAAMAAQMAQQMAAMAAVANQAGKQGGGGAAGSGGAAGAAAAAAAAAAAGGPGSLLRPPFALPPAMAAAMAAASSGGLTSAQQAAMRQAAGAAMAMAAAAAADPHAGLPPALQAIIPNGGAPGSTANGGASSGSRSRGRPARNARPRR